MCVCPSYSCAVSFFESFFSAVFGSVRNPCESRRRPNNAPRRCRRARVSLDFRHVSARCDRDKRDEDDDVYVQTSKASRLRKRERAREGGCLFVKGFCSSRFRFDVAPPRWVCTPCRLTRHPSAPRRHRVPSAVPAVTPVLCL